MKNIFQKTKSDSSELPFIGHLDELRSRIIKILLSFLICTIVAYLFKDEIFQILTSPLPKDVRIIHLKVYDKFMAYLKISLYSGIVFSFPIIVFQLSRFVLPALYSNERKWFFSSIGFVIILFFAGTFLSYKILAPASFQFLLHFDSEEKKELIDNKNPSKPSTKLQLDNIDNRLNEINDKLNKVINNKLQKSDQFDELLKQFIETNKITKELTLIYKDFLLSNENKKQQEPETRKIESLLSISEYLDSLIYFILATGVFFQLPLVITILAKLGIVNDKLLKKIRPYALIAILVIAAIITPPDAVSQLMVAVPIYLLYELSILLAIMMRKKSDRNKEKVG